MDQPTTSQAGTSRGQPNRGRFRGGRRPFRGNRQRGQRPVQENGDERPEENLQQDSRSSTPRSWSREERRPFRGNRQRGQRPVQENGDERPEENLQQDSRSSTPRSWSREERRPFHGTRQRDQHQVQRSLNSEQSSATAKVFDWFDQEYRDEKPEEKMEQDSRTSSPCVGPPRWQRRGQRDDGNHRNRRYSSGSTQSNQDGKRSPKYSKFHQLKRLSQMSGNEIAGEITGNPDFNILLNSEMNKDFTAITLQILSKLGRSDFKRIVTNVLSDVCQSKYLETLEHYLMELPKETRDNAKNNKFYWDDVNRFWNWLHDFFKALIDLGLVNFYDTFLKIIELIRFVKCQIDHEIDDDIEAWISKLKKQLKEKKTSITNPFATSNFRNLNIVPTLQDLNDHRPYIRPCKAHGAYDSVEHYLDVQYRLLREDFMCPLRQGIEEYKKAADANTKLSHVSDIRIFHKVKFIGPTVTKQKIGITVYFGIMKKVNWKLSKLFMYGSLLCLTKDNFKNVLFATVVERDPQLLAKGELIIEPCVEMEITKDMYSSEFLMVESKVYFLPYYHTLRSLRYMHEDNFPMKRYVVDAETIPNPPKYLDKSTVYLYNGFEIPVMDKRRWPSAKWLKFDQSQYEAFKCALLQEFSVLHGPPGTGKTFMALQIASVLLKNSSNWYDPSNPTPMIVVCLTNHALDQFLEGIMPHTESLVRIGGQSKNPNLAKYKLKTVRENYFKDETKKHGVWRRMTYHQTQLRQVSGQLFTAYSALKALISGTAIVSPEILRSYCFNDNELRGMTTTTLLTNLFGADYITPALGVKAAASNNSNLELNDNSESEDEIYEDMDDESEVASVISTSDTKNTCLEMDDLDAAIEKVQKELKEYEYMNEKRRHPVSAKDDPVLIEIQSRMWKLRSLLNTLQTRLSHHPLRVSSSLPCECPSSKDWEIYWHWVTSSHEVVKERISRLEEEYKEISAQLNDFKQMTDLEVMRNSLVVGLTTTGAARLHESLRALQAPIVLVEEAAEILETHVICSLTEHCQQVILIGDHKQLRPKPATYELEVNYNLNISLFERIVNMRDNCAQLVTQHRMRPQIAELISPSIYEKLENHISVFTYPAVKGLEKNVFFLNHKNHEFGDAATESMSNPFEVKFLLTFAKYLKQQGYGGDEITILCTYSGQLLKLKEAKKSMPDLRDVRITTVDNYQGEENRIILLSLVRNNHTGNVGFLKTENRVCVALSRAREGLYIMGNMENLVTNNQIWPKIKKSLEDNDAIGPCLVLQCQIHNDQLTEIKIAKDFKKSPYGGCLRQCDADLPCLHTCKKVCHLLDRDHKDYVCNEPCLRTCSRDHPCKLLCKEPCKPCQEDITVKLKKCGHTVRLACSTNLEEYRCENQVIAILRCGHAVRKSCHQDSSTVPCPHDCKKLLPCGHMCLQKCHIHDDANHLKYLCKEDCTKTAVNCPLSHPCPKKCHEICAICDVKVEKKRSCGHVYKIKCSQDVEMKQCTRLCTRDSPCGHRCKLKCNLPCGSCNAPVNKIVPKCGHEVPLPCSQVPTSAMCTAICSRTLKCGHPCVAQCKEKCTERCEYLRPLPSPSLCQHMYSVPCYKITIGLAEYADKLMQHCPVECTVQLPCGHVCSGSCGSCKQGRIHELCQKPCNRILICGHKCEALCKEPCPPCSKLCIGKCQHNVCKKKCREICTPCQEPCSWQCEHLRCTKRCFEICDREPCDKPCPKSIKCGHPCTGFCGELCPSICRICDEKDLPNFVREENKLSARFVLLPECGHSIESEYLDWVWQRSDRIGIKVCPICKTPITQCTRYKNSISKERKNINSIELLVASTIQTLRAAEQKITTDIDIIEKEYAVYFPDLNVHKKLFEHLRAIANPSKKLSVAILRDASIKLTIIGMILTKVKQIGTWNRDVNSWPIVLNQTIMLITSLPTNSSISYQLTDHVRNELIRLYYMVELCKLEKIEGFDQAQHALRIEIIYLSLLNLRTFTSSTGDLIHEQISELKKALKSPRPIEKISNIKIGTDGLNRENWLKCPEGHVYMTKCEQCIRFAPSAPPQ